MAYWIRRTAGGVLVAVVAALLGGCCTPGTEATALDVTVLRDATAAGKSVAVDFYGANASDLGAWTNVPVTTYWSREGQLRAAADVMTLTMGPGQTQAKLDRDDPHWALWKARKAWHLVVIAHVPGAAWEGDARVDPRRVVLPLDKCRWHKGGTQVRLTILSSGITCETPPDPEKP